MFVFGILLLGVCCLIVCVSLGCGFELVLIGLRWAFDSVRFLVDYLFLMLARCWKLVDNSVADAVVFLVFGFCG